ncbi:MAG: 2-oxoglutarate dehydrogenase E1 component [Myxococcota bacterium]
MSEADLATLFSGENGAWVERLYEDWVTGRAAVSGSWSDLFEGVAGRNGKKVPTSAAATVAVSEGPSVAAAPGAVGVVGLINAYRTYGHLVADLDPLGRTDASHPYLDPAEYGVRPDRLDRPVDCSHFRGAGRSSVRQLIEMLRQTYCGTFAVEFMGIQDKRRRDWLIEKMEPVRNEPGFSAGERLRILTETLAAERFEQFLQKRFLGQKRFSIEGGDALIPMLDFLVEDAEALGVREMVIAMAHRGRLNVMVHTMGMPYRAMLAQFQVGLQPRDAQGSGDVKYHRGYSADRALRSGRSIHLSLSPNPSHLEAINPVAEGIVRAKQNYRGDTGRGEVVPLVIHGDAAFSGQGLVTETLALSELDSYWTGGTVHVIVNNQIGFTADPADYRFTRHPSDTAMAIQAPVFHVNADDPEACVRAARLAIEYRQVFKEDVILDLVCYRRHGHNEGDDPTFTQPVLYRRIASHPTVATRYIERLVSERVASRAQVEALEAENLASLERALERSTEEMRLAGAEGYHGLWQGYSRPEKESDWRADTRVSGEVLDRIARRLVEFPESFQPHAKIRRLMEERHLAIEAGEGIDWGTAEALAFGTLLAEGHTVRITGQDVERGTFSHRHAVLHDTETGAPYIPLDGLCEDGDARLLIKNSMLSEAAVLGFEYGYSTVDPNRLTVWEAQFGDFANGAQVLIDQFIASAETKWGRSSGLVMLLPHGYEGQGPEHSSARLERFLQLCAEDNLQVCNLTTPAQYFHALRRQMHRNFRKPLVLMSPKSLLRHRAAVSTRREFEEGHFRCALPDPRVESGEVDPTSVRRLLVCSGKVYYALDAARAEHAFDDVAIVRLEQLHPFPFEELREVLSRFSVQDVAWVQEEPWNQGGWSFVKERLHPALPPGAQLRYIGRPEAASPATGSFSQHVEQEAEFLQEAFALHARRRLRG